MNTSLLTDEIFVQKMKEKLEEWKKEGEGFSDKRVAWDWMKYNVRLFSISYSKELAKTKRERDEQLQRKLQIVQAQIEQNPCEEVEKILDECKAELENFYEEKSNGLIVRARTRWHEYGEKSTKYFLSFGKERLYKKTHKEALPKWSYYQKLSKNIRLLLGILYICHSPALAGPYTEKLCPRS